MYVSNTLQNYIRHSKRIIWLKFSHQLKTLEFLLKENRCVWTSTILMYNDVGMNSLKRGMSNLYNVQCYSAQFLTISQFALWATQSHFVNQKQNKSSISKVYNKSIDSLASNIHGFGWVRQCKKTRRKFLSLYSRASNSREGRKGARNLFCVGFVKKGKNPFYNGIHSRIFSLSFISKSINQYKHTLVKVGCPSCIYFGQIIALLFCHHACRDKSELTFVRDDPFW